MSIDAGPFKRPELKPPRRIREGAGPVKPEPPRGHVERESPGGLAVIAALVTLGLLVWRITEAVLRWLG